MLRKNLCLAMLIGVLGVLLLAPAASAAPQAVGRVQKDGAWFTVYEETKPGDPNLYRYYVEDGAIEGSGGGARSNLKFYKRENGMESAAFIAATLLFAASVLAVHRRGNLMTLLHR